MKRVSLFLTIVLALFGLNACGSSANESAPAATVLLPTSSPSAAPTATLTPPPTVIPTPKLPVVVGTSIPVPSQILSAENVDQAVELARYGNGVITGEAYSPDGKIIAIASTIGISIYQADGLHETFNIITNAAVNGLAFSSNGAYLAGGLSDNSIKVWNTADGTLFKSFEVPKDETIKNKASPEQVISVAFSPDGSLLASGSTNGTVRLWKVADGSLTNTAKDHKARVSKVFFSPDGQAFFSASWDGTVRMLNVSDGKLIRSFLGEAVIDAKISADGKTLATYNHYSFGPHPSLILWDVQNGKNLQTIKENIQYSYYLDITSIALSPDGQFVAAGWSDRSVKIWSMSSGALQNTFLDLVPKDNYYYDNFMVQYSPDGRSLIMAGDNIIGMWNVANGSLLQNLKARSEPVYSLAISSDGKTLASVVGLNIIFWQIPDGKQLPVKGQMVSNGTIDFSPDGNSLATGFFDNTAHMLPLTDQGIPKSFETEKKEYISGVAFSPDGNVLALGVDNFPSKVELRQVADGTLLKSMSLGQRSAFKKMAFSPNGEFLGVSINNQIILVQVSDGKLLKFFVGSNGLAFSPDGTLLAGGSRDKTVNVWSIPSGKTIFTIKDRPDAVNSVVFSPDGKLLVSGSADGTIEVFLVSDGTLLKSWKGHSLGISDLIFSPDGKLLISSSLDGTIRFWGLKP